MGETRRHRSSWGSRAARGLLAAAVLPLLCGFVPFAHHGTCVVPVDGTLVEARALFNSEVSTYQPGVVMQARFPLRTGGDGYLTIDLRLVAPGATAPASFSYYEKLSPEVFGFEATWVEGSVVVVDRFEAGEETSLHIQFDATLSDGVESRVIAGGVAVTAPSPNVLRAHGDLPDGVVVLDDGSGTTFVAGGQAAYERGTLDCTGYVDEEVVVVEDGTYYEEEIVYDENGQPYDSSYDYNEDEEADTSCDGATDSGGYDDGTSREEGDSGLDCDSGGSSDSSSGYDTGGGGSSDTDCDSDGSSDSGSWDSSDSSSDSDSGFDCVGDAEASSLPPAVPARALHRGPRMIRAALRGQGGDAASFAGRVVSLSPMLALLLVLLLLREREAFRGALRRTRRAPEPLHVVD